MGLVAGSSLVFVLTLLVYRSSLSEWFYADDFWFLRAARETGWADWVRQSLDVRSFGPIPEFEEYRPVYFLAFKLEYQLFGLNAFWYHLANLGMHLATTGLVVYFALRLSRIRVFALAAGAVFALHPAFSGAVNWVVNGNSMLAGLLLMLSLLLFLSYLEQPTLVRYSLLLGAIVGAAFCHPATLTAAAGFVAVYVWLRLDGRPVRISAAPAVGLALVFLGAAIVYFAIGRYSDSTSGGVAFGPHIRDNYRELLGLMTVPFSESAVPAWSPYLTAGLMALGIAASLNRTRTALLLFWLVAALVPPSTMLLGSFARLLYLPGPAIALLAGDIFASCYLRIGDWLRTSRLTPAWPAAGVTSLVLLLAAWSQAGQHALKVERMPGPERQVGNQGSSNRELLRQLREQYPTLAAGRVVYVVGPPLNLVLFGDEMLSSLVRLYYPGVDARSMSPSDYSKVQVSTDEAVYFVYRPPFR